MAATVYAGTGNFTYNNTTGGNVRIIVMSCETESNTGRNGTITCGTATYPLYPNITWGKGIIAPTGNAVLQPVQYMVANGSSFSLEGAPTGSPTGQQVYENANNSVLSDNWTVPSNVTSVCVVCVGGGGYDSGDGGDLSWKNHIPVTPASTVPYQVGKKADSGDPDGGDTWFKSIETVLAPGAPRLYGTKSERFGDGGGSGGEGKGGGGGAGGYTGDGGDGANSSYPGGGPGKGGGGGGGGYTGTYAGGSGGGVGLMGQGANGKGGYNASNAASMGEGGSGGADGGNTSGGDYGGGGGSGSGGIINVNGGKAAMRIIWGDGRAFPAYNTGDDETGVDTVISSYNIVVIPEGN